MQLEQRAKVAARLVEDILRKWDPIGVIQDLIADGLPPDEYDSYAPYIVGMLGRGASLDELAAHLEYCRTRAMGLGPDTKADQETAKRLLKVWNQVP